MSGVSRTYIEVFSLCLTTEELTQRVSSRCGTHTTCLKVQVPYPPCSTGSNTYIDTHRQKLSNTTFLAI